MLPTPKGRRFFVRPATALAALALLVTLAGCGSARQPRLDTADASSLEGMLANVRASAQRGDRATVLGTLAALRARVERLESAGALPAAEAPALRTGVARAIAAAERELEPPPAQTVVAARPAPPTAVVRLRTHDRHPEHPRGPKEHPPAHGPGGPRAHGDNHGEEGGPRD
jgi:hypothetical protein